MVSEKKLSESIEAYLTSRESEPASKPDIYRLSPWAATFVAPLLLIPAFLVSARYPVLSNVLIWSAILIVAVYIERRRVCRIEIDSGGMRCYGLTGRMFLEVDRKSVEDIDLDEGDGKDYYVWAAGVRHRIPTMYDGFHRVVGVLKGWASENRAKPYSPRA